VAAAARRGSTGKNKHARKRSENQAAKAAANGEMAAAAENENGISGENQRKSMAKAASAMAKMKKPIAASK